MNTFALALALATLQQFPDWRHPAWGASSSSVANQLGLTSGESKGTFDLNGMEAKVRGPFSYGPYPAFIDLYFRTDHLTAISIKLDNDRDCPKLDLEFAANLGRPISYEHVDSGFMDAWMTKRGDRMTIIGTEKPADASVAPSCVVVIEPPKT